MHNSKSGDENPSKPNEEELVEELQEQLKEKLRKEIEEQAINALEEDLETKVTTRFIELRKSFADSVQNLTQKQDAMDVDLNQISSVVNENSQVLAQTNENIDNFRKAFIEELNNLSKKLSSNTDFKEIIEAQTRKFLEEHPELLKPSSRLSTEVESLTNSYKVMSDRVEKLEATATKFADDRAIKKMQEKYDNLETKYTKLEDQVKQLSETQTNA